MQRDDGPVVPVSKLQAAIPNPALFHQAEPVWANCDRVTNKGTCWRVPFHMGLFSAELRNIARVGF
jgi:hypothetical protein